MSKVTPTRRLSYGVSNFDSFLSYSQITLALTANDKTEILKEEWKAAVEKPAVGDKTR